MSKIALILIDMLNDFVTGDLKTERASKIIPNLKRLVEAARDNGVPVIYSNDAHYEHDFEIVRKWGSHAIKDTPGAQVIPELKGKLDGMAIRVPTPDGSITDFVCEVEKEPTVEEINNLFKSVSNNELKNVIEYSEEPLVLKDIVGKISDVKLVEVHTSNRKASEQQVNMPFGD